jgi:hypothetical protein
MCRWNYFIPFITQVNILLTDLILFYHDFELQRILLCQINEEPLIGTKFSIQLTLLSYKFFP